MNAKAIAEEYPVDVRYLFARLLERRRLILWSTLSFSVIFSATSWLTTPVYRASVLLAPATADRHAIGSSLTSALGGLGGLASIVGIGSSMGDAETGESLAVLQSRQFTERFIERKKLLPILASRYRHSLSNIWKWGETKTMSPAQAFRYFDRKIRTVTQDKKTGLVELQIDWVDRNEAAAWANDLVDELNSEMRAREIDMVDASLGFLQTELAKASDVGTREAINRLIESKIRQRMLANVTNGFAFRVLDKALPPDPGDSLFPHRWMLVAAGPLVGLFSPVLWLLLFAPLARRS